MAIPVDQKAKVVILRAQIHQQVKYQVAVADNAKAVLLAASWLLLGMWLDEDRIDTALLDLAQELNNIIVKGTP